jgi:DNA-binding transcriptional ArsR family regulator
VIDASVIEVRPRADEAQPLLAVAADPVRWRLLTALADRGTHCVCELQPVAGVAANVLSYHLKVLREAGLVTSAKRGRWVDYTLAPDAPARLATSLPTAVTADTRDPGSGG